MTVIGGPIQAVTVMGRYFSVAGGSEPKLHIGGWINTVERNGDGSSRVTQARSGWSLTDVLLVIDQNSNDLEFLAGASPGFGTLANGNDLVLPFSRFFRPIEIELITGFTYSGKGVVSGKIDFDTATSTALVSFEGDGALL